ncbi:sorbosone dehydrogenase family protein [Methylocystis sp. SB2]|uniref:PQQ-dependent sugar dehydrogenase n=1 Tax=Methylocystis sp. (strain SB2) TaxID=743836 RepID=UPI000424B8AB|nr:sorbosone dehydrogenase family protein [Methylocystis sp. SB2]ULO22970.1 sorbosone dehydrogenase family protein [Methylocystis sp. SB2]
MMKQPMIIGVLGLALTMSVTFPSGSSSETVERRIGVAAFSDWHADDPGVWRKIAPDDLPRPLASEPKASRSEVVARPEGATPKTLEGFSVEAFATGLTGPRVIRVAPNGDILVAESSAGRVRVFRLADGAIKPEKSEIFASDLERPYGVAFYPPGPDPKFVYVGTVSKIVRFPYRKGDLKASGPAEVVASLPASETGHWTRDIAFSADGKTLFVAVGSKSNVADGHVRPSPTEVAELEARNGVGASSGPEQDRANILAFNPNGGDKRVFARGIRNCSGLQVRPNTDDLWCVVNERDMLGDDLPPDYATRVEPGAFYGWPWYYIGANPDPRHAGARPDLADKVTTPDVLLQPHSAPLGIAFYEGAQFPPEFKGDAFVALHGSWNRAKRTGYKVVRLRFKDGRPTGEYQDFLTGFVVDDARVWGRPVDVAVAPDGSLLVSEDGNGTIWRVFHNRK